METVADTEDGDAHGKDSGVDSGCVGVVGRVWRTREDDT